MNDYRQGPQDEIQEMIEQFQRKIQSFTKNFGANFKGVVVIVLLVVAVIVGFTMFYTVQPQEEAVVLRLGRYLQTTQPGLHIKLPLGIDSVYKIKTKLILQEEFGFRSSDHEKTRTQYSSRNFKDESLMLTGDLNVADVEWVLQYQISDPQKYLFHVRDVKKNLRDVSQSIMRRVVGDRVVDEVLTTGRVDIAQEAKNLTQAILNNYDIGIRVVAVKLQDVNPPDAVKASFNEVNEAKQEKEKTINQAEEHYNKIIPEARGKADQTIKDAEGYATALINRARGDAENFEAKLKAYQQAPKITQTRLYLETVESLYGNMSEMIIVDSNIKGILPVFDSNVLKEMKGGQEK